MVARLREVWRYRHLLGYFSTQTVRRVYKRTVLGRLWLLSRPLFPVVVSTFVFHELAAISSGDVPYFLFFLVGTSVWNLFEESLMWATRSLQMYQRLLRKLYFPRLILPVASTGPGLVEFLIHLVLIALVVLYYVVSDGRFYLVPGPNLVMAVAAVLLALLLAIGIGLFTAVLGAEYRDVRFSLRYVLRFWFFLTPIIYQSQAIPNHLRWLTQLNPMTTIVELFKEGLLGISGGIHPFQVVLTVAMVGAVLSAGLWYFVRFEAESVDRL